jgi:hypothetical protein
VNHFMIDRHLIILIIFTYLTTYCKKWSLSFTRVLVLVPVSCLVKDVKKLLIPFLVKPHNKKLK